jgi:hypothetical protein
VTTRSQRKLSGLVEEIIDLFGEAICRAATEPDGDNDAAVFSSETDQPCSLQRPAS